MSVHPVFLLSENDLTSMSNPETVHCQMSFLTPDGPINTSTGKRASTIEVHVAESP